MLARDAGVCQLCGAPDSSTVDHIVPFAIAEHMRFDIDNGRTLCRPCHMATPTYTWRTNQLKRVIAEVQGVLEEMDAIQGDI